MDGFWFCGWLAGWLVVVRDLGLGLAPTLVAQLFAPGSARDALRWRWRWRCAATTRGDWGGTSVTLEAVAQLDRRIDLVPGSLKVRLLARADGRCSSAWLSIALSV